MNTKYKNDLQGFWSSYSYDVGHAGIYGLLNSSLKSILTRDNFIQLIEGAATAGHLHILKFVSSKVPKIFKRSNVLEISKLNNHVSVLEWLEKKGFECGDGVQVTVKPKKVCSRTSNGVVKRNASSNKKRESIYNLKDLVEAFTVVEDGSPSFLEIALAHKRDV